MVPVLFEDDDLLAVDKPEGLAVIPERARAAPCLMDLLAPRDPGRRLFVVHRIDKDVSGVLLVAKSAAAHREMNRLFETRAVRKGYVAVVHGRMGAPSGRITARIRQFGSSRMGVDPRRGKPSLTTWRVMDEAGACTRLAVHPVSGRRHQIRVHLYSIGHPVVGDPWYGDPETQRGFPRLLLHARSVAFTRPDGRTLRIVSPLPASFLAVVAGLRGTDGTAAGRKGDNPGRRRR
jgi:tRNA pseudouridine32 synthase/23S rRNA pseudouridine746 synthase